MSKYIVEFIGTFFLVLVVALTGNPIAIGAVLIAAVYMGGYISGAHYNPAVGIGPILYDISNLSNHTNALVVYLLGPFTGGALAGLLYNKLK